MTLRPQDYYRKRRPAVNQEPGNPGVCTVCGKQASWRSVNNRCRTCEMEEMRARPPMYIERDVLVTNSNSESHS